LPIRQPFVIETTSGPLLPFSADVTADIARTWKIRDRGARADLSELAQRAAISFQDAQCLILSAAAPDIAHEIARPQRERGQRGLIRPLFDLHGDERERWLRRQLKRLAERLLLHDFPMLVSMPVDSLPSSVRTDELRADVHAARIARDIRADCIEKDIAWLRSIATPSQRAMLDVWLEFARLGEQPTHARVAAAIGIDPATVRNQCHIAYCGGHCGRRRAHLAALERDATLGAFSVTNEPAPRAQSPFLGRV
jgi:hypothetical protein